MSEQQEIPTTNEVTSYIEAEEIVKLGEITINNPFYEPKSKIPADRIQFVSLFDRSHKVSNPQFIWWYLLQKQPSLPKNRLKEVATLLQQPNIQADIRQVHDKVIGTTIHPLNTWFTSTMVYPLIESLTINPSQPSKAIFDQWRDDWSSGIDPEKFRIAISLLFKVASIADKDYQEELLGNIDDQPINPSEAELLAGVFEKVYGENNDLGRIHEADSRNRMLVDQMRGEKIKFTSQDLFHTTDLSTLPLTIDKGLLSPECISLTMDWMGEAHFAVSFHMFKNPPSTLVELGKKLREGPDTIRKHPQKIHLAFTNPQNTLDDQYILYPPDSSYFDRKTRSNKIAGRYIPGYDASNSDRDFADKAPAYVLIGMPSPALSFVVLDEGLKQQYESIAKNFPFYLPAYSYQGKLLYTPEEHDIEKTL